MILLKIAQELVIALMSLLYAAFLLRLLYPTAFHKAELWVRDAWEWLLALRDAQLWAAEWERKFELGEDGA